MAKHEGKISSGSSQASRRLEPSMVSHPPEVAAIYDDVGVRTANVQGAARSQAGYNTQIVARTVTKRAGLCCVAGSTRDENS